MLNRISDCQYLQFRLKTFAERRDQAVLVQGLPPNITAAAVVEKFRKIFPDVTDARLAYDCRDVEALLALHGEVVCVVRPHVQAITRRERAAYDLELAE